MTKIVTYICDKCNTEAEALFTLSLERTNRSISYRSMHTPRSMELCEECSLSVLNYIDDFWTVDLFYGERR